MVGTQVLENIANEVAEYFSLDFVVSNSTGKKLLIEIVEQCVEELEESNAEVSAMSVIMKCFNWDTWQDKYNGLVFCTLKIDDEKKSLKGEPVLESGQRKIAFMKEKDGFMLIEEQDVAMMYHKYENYYDRYKKDRIFNGQGLEMQSIEWYWVRKGNSSFESGDNYYGRKITNIRVNGVFKNTHIEDYSIEEDKMKSVGRYFELIDSSNGFAEINTNICDENMREIKTENCQTICSQNAPSNMVESYISNVLNGLQKTDSSIVSEIINNVPYNKMIKEKINVNEFIF